MLILQAYHDFPCANNLTKLNLNCSFLISFLLFKLLILKSNPKLIFEPVSTLSIVLILFNLYKFE